MFEKRFQFVRDVTDLVKKFERRPFSVRKNRLFEFVYRRRVRPGTKFIHKSGNVFDGISGTGPDKQGVCGVVPFASDDEFFELCTSEHDLGDTLSQCVVSGCVLYKHLRDLYGPNLFDESADAERGLPVERGVWQVCVFVCLHSGLTCETFLRL